MLSATKSDKEYSDNHSLEVDSTHSTDQLTSMTDFREKESRYMDSMNIIRSRTRLSQIARRPLPIVTSIVAFLLTTIGQSEHSVCLYPRSMR
jgi:hypothetical protein